MMTEKLKQFIENNIDLINKDTKESWEKIYNVDFPITGLTEIMLEAGIDPAKRLDYIPKYYLYKSSIKEYNISPNVTSIGEEAFYNCSSLTSIEISNGVTSIDYYAFSGCDSLTSIEIPNSVISIGDWVFDGCSSLTSVVIGDSVTSIGFGAFSDCSSLTSVIIPDGVTIIDSMTFYNCTSLINVVIPKSVTYIGGHALKCRRLKSIKYEGTINDWNKIRLEGEGTDDSWRYKILKKIICTDGIIEL